MKTKINRSLAMAVVALMVLSQACVYAGEEGNTAQGANNKEAHFKKMSEELKLTPQQSEQLTKQREEFASKSKDLRDKMQAARTGLKAELDKPAPDKAAVDGLVAEMKNMTGQQIQNRVDKVMAMKQILTPEQFSKMGESMKDRKHEKGEKGDKRGKDGKKYDKDDVACTM
jgi:Spy/CpxP family protein refolding chaperone